jgi:hypothetical protein
MSIILFMSAWLEKMDKELKSGRYWERPKNRYAQELTSQGFHFSGKVSFSIKLGTFQASGGADT